MIPKEFKKELCQIVKSHNKIVILGIGENRMTDDGFGPFVSYHLHSLDPKFRNLLIINGKTNYVDRKKEILEFYPDLLLIVDTCQPNNNVFVQPGTLMITKEESFLQWLPLSSHVLPIPVFISELKKTIENLHSILLGITPVSTDYNESVEPFRPDLYSLDDYDENPDLPFYNFNLSPKIQKIALELASLLKEILLEEFDPN